MRNGLTLTVDATKQMRVHLNMAATYNTEGNPLEVSFRIAQVEDLLNRAEAATLSGRFVDARNGGR